MKSDFMKTKGRGMLKYDRILFEDAYPMLFTCTDSEDRLYLCLCCQFNREGVRWLVKSVQPGTVIRMLQNKITIRDAFLADSDYRLECFKSAKGRKSCTEGISPVWNEDSKYIPKADSYMDPEEDEFAEEIRHYESFRARELIASLLTYSADKNETVYRVNISAEAIRPIEYGTNRNRL